MLAAGEPVMRANELYGSAALIAVAPMSGAGSSAATRPRAIQAPIASTRNDSLLTYGDGSAAISITVDVAGGGCGSGCSNALNTPRRSRNGIAHRCWNGAGLSGSENSTAGVPVGNSALSVSTLVCST